MINATDQVVADFLRLWHEAGRAYFQRFYPNLDYDSDAYAKVARQRRKYIALDRGRNGHGSGVFMVDRESGTVYPIKAYGVPNCKRPLGVLAEIVAGWDALPMRAKVWFHRP